MLIAGNPSGSPKPWWRPWISSQSNLSFKWMLLTLTFWTLVICDYLSRLPHNRLPHSWHLTFCKTVATVGKVGGFKHNHSSRAASGAVSSARMLHTYTGVSLWCSDTEGEESNINVSPCDWKQFILEHFFFNLNNHVSLEEGQWLGRTCTKKKPIWVYKDAAARKYNTRFCHAS